MTATFSPSDDHARLVPTPLTGTAFSAFGTVLQTPTGLGRSINAGSSERFDLVDDLQLGAAGGRAQLALFRAQARSFPLQILEMERHCLGSQTFVPWGVCRFVLVAWLPQAIRRLRLRRSRRLSPMVGRVLCWPRAFGTTPCWRWTLAIFW